jgi:hypothetical protein
MLQSVLGGSQLNEELAHAQQVANAQDDFRSIQRFDQKVIGAQQKGTVPSGATRVAGEDYHGKEAEAFSSTAESPEHLLAIDAGHVQVEKDDIGLELTERALDLPRVGEAVNFRHCVAQEFLEQKDIRRVVVNDQNARTECTHSLSESIRASSPFGAGASRM